METTERPLASVVTAAAAGDPDAWADLVERFQDFAVASALGWDGDWDGARDTAQEAFALAVTRIGELEDPAAFPGWFAKVVRTACSRRARKRVPVPVAFALGFDGLDGLDGVDGPDTDVGDPATAALAAEEAAAVRASVEALPRPERTVIALHYLGGLSYVEVAAWLGISEPAVRKRAWSARRRLKELLPMTTDALSAARPSLSGGFRDVILLFAAIRRRDREGVARLLRSDPQLVHATEAWSWDEATRAGLRTAERASPLIRAVEGGDLAIVRALVEAGAPVDAPCACAGAESPLWVASLHGSSEIVGYLLASGADPDAAAFSGSTPLHAATHRGHDEVAAMLAAAGADPANTDDHGRTASEWAVLHHVRGERAEAENSNNLVSTGIRALDLFAPIGRGDVQHWPPAVELGQTVLLYAIADALLPVETWWIGFAYGPYDATSHRTAVRELAVGGQLRLVPEGSDPGRRRGAFEASIRELTAAPGDKLVVCLNAPGHDHDVTLALPALTRDPSVVATLVVEPLVDGRPRLGAEPPEGFDGQVAFDVRRALRNLWPAIDPSTTVSRRYPSERHRRLATRARAVVADYCGVDGGFELPDPGSLPDPRAAATAQELLRYLAQPFSICEAFTAMPGESTSYPDLLEAVETIVGVG